MFRVVRQFSTRLFLRYSSIKLRPYQQECLSTILEELKTVKKPAVSLPTGSGKTILFTSLIPKIPPQNGQGNKTLIIVNRREIAIQTVETLHALLPELKVSLEMAKNKASDIPDADVCVASVHSLCKPSRLAAFDPADYKLMIIDEAHHGAAESYLTIAKHFGTSSPDPKIYCVGFSATFFRKDRLSLEELFQKVIYHRLPQEMIDDGHLCGIKLTNISFDWPDSGTKKDDTNYLLTESGLDFTVNLYKETYPTYKSTTIFCINRKHGELLMRKFQEEGIVAHFLDGTMRPKTREKLLSDFRAQVFPVLINCMILTEGTDIPNIDQIMLATPLHSKALTMQMVGRGLRLYPGKTHCNIVYFSGITSVGSGSLTPMLEGLAPLLKEENKELNTRTGSNKKLEEFSEPDEITLEYSDQLETIFRVEDLRPGIFKWLKYGSSQFEYLFSPPAYPEFFRMKHEKSDKKWHLELCRMKHGRRDRLPYYVYNIQTSFDSRLEAINAANTLAFQRWGGPKTAKYMHRNAPWRASAATEKQVAFLQKNEISGELIERINRGTATDLINLKVIGFKINNANVEKLLDREQLFKDRVKAVADSDVNNRMKSGAPASAHTHMNQV